MCMVMWSPVNHITNNKCVCDKWVSYDLCCLVFTPSPSQGISGYQSVHSYGFIQGHDEVYHWCSYEDYMSHVGCMYSPWLRCCEHTCLGSSS